VIPEELEALVQGALYRPKRRFVGVRGKVYRHACRAEISRPLSWAVSNQCSNRITHKIGGRGFCKVHYDQILNAYKVSLVLLAEAYSSFEVDY
jgi:hypothetical protein